METDDTARPVPQRPFIEWIVGTLSAALVAGLAGYLLYEAAFGDVRPPDLRVTIENVEPVDGGTQARIVVRNHGDRAASGVTVRATGLRDDTRQIEFDYVAGHSVRYGAIILPQQISASDLRIEIGGYVEP